MLLYNYFSEIKNRIILICICWSTIFIVCCFYKEVLLFLLVKLSIKKNKLIFFYFITTNLTDVFIVYLDISYFISNQLIIVHIFYHILMFVSSGLFIYEYKKIRFFSVVCLVFALFSIYLLNNYILSYIWYFFLSFNTEFTYNVDIFFESKITEYVYFYKRLYYLFILISQFFGLIFITIECVANKLKFILKTRKLFYLFFLITATILTPSDILSQLFLMFSFVWFFEILILLSILKTYF